MRARFALLGLAVLAAGCGSSHAAVPAPPRAGPPGVARIALAEMPWPLDPALLHGRDGTQLGRVLFSTPFRVDSAGRLRDGLCSQPKTSGSRVWTFRCRDAAAIAAELRRVGSLRASPSRWLFAGARIHARGDKLHIALPRRWRRFPYALSAVAAAPPGVPGPFRVVTVGPSRVVAERPGLRLVFTQMEPHAAAVAFRRGALDEAPVAVGDIRAARLDPAVAGMVRVRPLLGVDLVALSIGLPRALRRIYWQTPDRQSYQALVPEFTASAAYGLTPEASTRGGDAAVRAARRAIGVPHLRPLHVAVADPALLYEADLATAQWRDLGLDARIRPGGSTDAAFERVIAPYPLPQALLGQVLLGGYPTTPSAATLRRALAGNASLAQTDDGMQKAALVVPLTWVSDARLVSPRLVGWRRDDLGSVDYLRVRVPAVSPRR